MAKKNLLDKVVKSMAKTKRSRIPRNAPVYVPIRSDADIDKWMKSVNADPRPDYTLEDIGENAYWEIVPEEESLYKEARKIGRGIADLDESNDRLIYMYGNPTYLDVMPPSQYVEEIGYDPDYWGLEEFPWGEDFGY